MYNGTIDKKLAYGRRKKARYKQAPNPKKYKTKFAIWVNIFWFCLTESVSIQIITGVNV